MDITTDIYLNQLGQRVIDQKDGVEWFNNLEFDIQIEVMRSLVYFILQMGAVGKDAEIAVKKSGLKPTYTPCHLLLKAAKDDPLGRRGLSLGLSKVINLPDNERIKSFVLLLSLFNVTDKKKREKGVFPERYWWHRDLSDEKEVEKIIKEFS